MTGDKIIAGYLDHAGNLVSGLDLTEIGEDGHAVANLLWKLSAYLTKRGDNEYRLRGMEHLHS